MITTVTSAVKLHNWTAAGMSQTTVQVHHIETNVPEVGQIVAKHLPPPGSCKSDSAEAAVPQLSLVSRCICMGLTGIKWLPCVAARSVVNRLRQAPSFLDASAELLGALWDLPDTQVLQMLQV